MLKTYLNKKTIDEKIEYYLKLNISQQEDLKEKLQNENPREFRKLIGKLTSMEREISLFDEAKINKIEIDKLVPNPFQPRKKFDEEKIKELAESIKENGQISPILVSRTKDNNFIIIAGERRYRAFKLLSTENPDKYKEIDAKVINNASEKQLKIISLIENIHRENLSIYEEAKTFARLNKEMTILEIVDKVKQSKTKIWRLIKIGKIDEDILNEAEKNGINSIVFLEMIADIKDKKKQKEAIELYSKGNSIEQVKNIIFPQTMQNENEKAVESPNEENSTNKQETIKSNEVNETKVDKNVDFHNLTIENDIDDESRNEDDNNKIKNIEKLNNEKSNNKIIDNGFNEKNDKEDTIELIIDRNSLTIRNLNESIKNEIIDFLELNFNIKIKENK